MDREWTDCNLAAEKLKSFGHFGCHMPGARALVPAIDMGMAWRARYKQWPDIWCRDALFHRPFTWPPVVFGVKRRHSP